MSTLQKTVFGLWAALLIIPIGAYSIDSPTLAPKSRFGAQFENDRNNYYPVQEDNYYYNYPIYPYNPGHRHHYHHYDRDYYEGSPRTDRPYYFWGPDGYYLHWPTNEDAK